MSRIEALLYRRIPLWVPLALGLIGLLCLLANGAVVGYAAAGGQEFPWLTKPLLAVANLPVDAMRAATTGNYLPITHERREPLPAGFARLFD